jgi:tight adherence protein B
VQGLTQLTVIYIIIFCAVLLGVQGAYWSFAEQQRTRGAINRRLVLAKQGAHAQEVFETLRRERGLIGLDSEHFVHLNDLILQTGLRLDQKLLVLVAFCLSVVFFLLFGLAFGYGLIAFFLAALSSALSLVLFLTVARRRRIAQFSEQLPEAIDVIVRGVKSGYPFTVALALVAKEMTDPIGTEFGMTSDEISFGSEVGAALDNLFHRVGHEDLLYLTMAIKIQTQTGGNLAEILSRLARLLRERQMLRLKVRAISAEGRLSGVFLTATPFVLFGIISLMRPDYYYSPEVVNNPIIMPTLILALIMLALGNVIIYRMVNFKV